MVSMTIHLFSQLTRKNMNFETTPFKIKTLKKNCIKFFDQKYNLKVGKTEMSII